MHDWHALHATWSPIIAGIAASKAGRVMHLRGDLYQLGWEVLLERTDYDPEQPEDRGILCRILANAMVDHRTLWLSGNVGRHPKSKGEKVITTPGDPMLNPEPPGRVVVDSREARGQVRSLIPPRALELFDKKAQGRQLSGSDSVTLSRARKSLAARLAQTHPPIACANCHGYPEYMGEDGVWRCYLHRTRPVLLFNHPQERNLWDLDKIDTDAPRWRRYPRLTDGPQPSPEYREWLARFKAKPVEDRDEAVQAWTRRRRSTLA